MNIIPLNKKNIKESKKVYQQIFSDSSWYVNSKLKARGIHDVVANEFESKIRNKTILDIGCGYGRFSFIVSPIAKKVIGLDMMPDAVKVANDIKKSISTAKNIDFICETVENFNYSEKFDFIFLSGTLEHIINPDQVLTKISSLIKKNGTFVTDSPSEYNIRGTVHATLWKLFEFPVTLSDVRIITPKYMNQLFKKYKFKQNNHIIGTLFSRGWGKALYADLSKRIPKIIEDVKKVKKIDVSDKMIMNYFEWLKESETYIPKIYENWIKNKYLKKIQPFRNRNYMINKKLFTSNKISLEDAVNYMKPDFKIDPYYSTVEFVSHCSGNIIYSGTKI